MVRWSDKSGFSGMTVISDMGVAVAVLPAEAPKEGAPVLVYMTMLTYIEKRNKTERKMGPVALPGLQMDMEVAVAALFAEATNRGLVVGVGIDLTAGTS